MTDTPPRSADDALAKLDVVRAKLANRRSTDDVMIKIIMSAVAQEVRPWMQRVENLERRIEELAARPVTRYAGVWREGTIYHCEELATDHGSLWHCRAEMTVERPGQSKDWQLIAKRGAVR